MAAIVWACYAKKIYQVHFDLSTHFDLLWKITFTIVTSHELEIVLSHRQPDCWVKGCSILQRRMMHRCYALLVLCAGSRLVTSGKVIRKAFPRNNISFDRQCDIAHQFSCKNPIWSYHYRLCLNYISRTKSLTFLMSLAILSVMSLAYFLFTSLLRCV